MVMFVVTTCYYDDDEIIQKYVLHFRLAGLFGVQTI